MIWLLDLGNSRLKAAAWGPGLGVGDVQAWTHAAADFVPSLQRWVQGVRPGDRGGHVGTGDRRQPAA